MKNVSSVINRGERWMNSINTFIMIFLHQGYKHVTHYFVCCMHHCVCSTDIFIYIYLENLVTYILCLRYWYWIVSHEHVWRCCHPLIIMQHVILSRRVTHSIVWLKIWKYCACSTECFLVIGSTSHEYTTVPQ